jgi:hypothetical protein
MNVKRLKGTDLDAAHDAVGLLIKVGNYDHVDREYETLDKMRKDLQEEQVERRNLAKQM